MQDTTVTASATADEVEQLRLLVASVDDYAILLLAPDGTVMTCNPGAQRLRGHREHEVVGKNFRVFYPPDDIAAGKPERELADALRDGVLVDDGWQIGHVGRRFWAHVVITPLYDGPVLRGFAKVTRDETAARKTLQSGRAMTDITRALLDGMGVTDVLAMVAGQARRLTGCAQTWIVTPLNAGFVIRAADGSLSEAPAGAELPGDPVMIDVVAAGQPRCLDDLRASCPGLPGLSPQGTGLLVPMVADTGRTIGVLVAAASTGSLPFQDADVEMLQAFANQAALALTYALAQQALRERDIGDDRERIARDLHERVIQQLFGAGMGLQSAAGRAEDESVKTLIEGACDNLDSSIRQIRTTIFDLLPQGGELRSER